MVRRTDHRVAETQLADLYLRLHRYEEAEQLIESALAQQPHHRPTRFKAAVVLGACTKLGRALELLESLFADRPDDGAVMEKKAWVLWLMHRYEEAATAARHALEVMPDSEICLRRLVEYETLSGNPRRAGFDGVIEVSRDSRTAKRRGRTSCCWTGR